MARFVRDRLAPLADFPVGSSIFAWDRETGAWAVRSMSDWVFRLRSQGTWTTGYDTVVAGDFDRDGSSTRCSSGIVTAALGRPEHRQLHAGLPVAAARFTVGYDDVIVGDFDGDGFLNDLFIWDHDTGNWVIQSMSGFRPTYRCQRHVQPRATT